ncbi:MAG: Na/Pi cotransporter family protein [Lachnospiraceae bacterium]|nr:Na/Pi cotransporter family protein [Lachnospiraceae bacterium]
MSEVLEVIFGLFGGLALFLFGMNMMSDSLQKVAGDKMKAILGALTRNRVLGVLAGALVTAVLQSSSATTVLVIGFVSAGLMTLPQGISVIFGANIGTTMTAQLLAFKISDYIWPIIFIGFMIQFVAKNERIKYAGQTILGFGLLFVGIETMGDVMKPLASSAFFVNLMDQVKNIPILGVGLGALMTLVVQSSSATIAVLQNFASQAGPDGVSSVIGLAGAIPILLGDNIGTTITALLASIGLNKNARRTAIAHSVFNITGSVVFLFLLKPFTWFVTLISPTGVETEIISRQIANAHMMFNIINTLIWLPLLGVMVWIVMKLVPDAKEEETDIILNETKFIDDNVLGQPAAAMILVSKEIERAAKFAGNQIASLKAIFAGKDKNAAERMEQTGEAMETIEKETSTYISRMFSHGGLTEQQSAQTASLLYFLNNLARINNCCMNMLPVANDSATKKITFSKAALGEFDATLSLVEDMYRNAMEAVRSGDVERAKEVLEEQKKLQDMEREYNVNHLVRLRESICDPERTADFNGILHNFWRLGSGCTNIAEEAMDHEIFEVFPAPDESMPTVEI